MSDHPFSDEQYAAMARYLGRPSPLAPPAPPVDPAGSAPTAAPSATSAPLWTGSQVLAAAHLLPLLPTRAAPAFPPAWRRTDAGRFVYAVMAHLGRPNWEAVSHGERNQFRALYSLQSFELVPEAPPPAVIEPVVQLEPSPIAPTCSDMRDNVTVVPALLAAPPIVRAFLGDALHKWDIRLVSFSMGLRGAELSAWHSYHGSNAHQAAYLCDVEDLVYPSTRSEIKALGDRFESQYLEVDFRHTYLSMTFGHVHYQLVATALPELL